LQHHVIQRKPGVAENILTLSQGSKNKPSKKMRRSMQQASEVHNVAAQNTVLFIAIAVRTANPTLYILIDFMVMLGFSGQTHKSLAR
jgi:arginine exporter protein ArgO